MSSSAIDNFCATGQINSNFKFSQNIADEVNTVDLTMRQNTANYMCTQTCLCPSSINPSLWSCTILNSNNRTALGCPTVNLTTGVIYTPLYVNATPSQPVYHNFWDCYLYLKNASNYYNGSSNGVQYGKYLEDVSSGLQDLISNLESTFSCNGICTAGAFYYFKDISAGPPTTNCLQGIKSILQNKPIACGILLLICFVTIFFAFFTSYGLCYSKEQKH